MRKLISGIATFLIWTTFATAQSFPDYDELFVNDFAFILSSEEETTIREKLVELRKERGIEFTVVTIDSMFSYGHNGDIEPFATGLFNEWGVGDADRNDGVMMLIAVNDRLMRIEVGSGYGTDKNIPMKNIIDTSITPHFKKGNYFKGTDRGVDSVIRELTGVWPGEFDATGSEKAFNATKRTADRIGDWIYAVWTALAGGAYILFRRWQRNRPRRCPNDRSKMERIQEDLDDDYLEAGQITEERLKSVDYDVWHCMRCDHRTIEGYKHWFSGYGACRSCGYKTLDSDTTILESSTTTSTGLKRIDYACKHCHDTWSVKRVIPKKSSSSSSSGGSSFGGGSSSGGGASGSW
ncbi:MAG: TPM domain-containing protein [Shimia sp.]|uniref:TPM domain-containing protein n=1 Tax=Shimia sp. TaxID=1954381 RepID=UPI004058A1C5